MATLRRGLRAVQEAKNTGGGGGKSDRRFFLKENESALVRFFGNFEEEEDPVVGTIHYVKRLPPGQQYNNCAQNVPDGHAGCVFCYCRDNGDRGISMSDRAYFRLKDYRKSHKLENEVKVLKPGVRLVPGKAARPGDYITTKYPMCSAPRRPCQYCASGNEAKPEGYKYWELSTSHAEQLVALQAELRDYCKCGTKVDDPETGESTYATIQVVQYVCKCGTSLDHYDPSSGHTTIKCPGCRKVVPPLEEIQCTACEDPQRADLQDFQIRVTRSGTGSDTGYNFQAVHPCKPPTEEELQEAEKYKPEWTELLAADPAEVQAKKLGIPCPFNTEGHGYTEYPEETEEEDDYSTMVAAPPKKPAPATAPKPAPKPAAQAPKPTPKQPPAAVPKPAASGGKLRLPKIVSKVTY